MCLLGDILTHAQSIRSRAQELENRDGSRGGEPHGKDVESIAMPENEPGGHKQTWRKMDDLLGKIEQTEKDLRSTSKRNSASVSPQSPLH